MAHITGYHSQTQPALHPFLPMIAACAPSIIASQARDSPLDARTPAIAAPPGARVFQRFAFLGKFAGGWDRHPLDACGGERGLCLGRVDAAIPGHRTGRMVKERDAVCHRLDGLPMFVGMLQNLIARHDPPLDFIEDDVPPKLDQGPTFVSRNGAGVGFKDPRALSGPKGLSCPPEPGCAFVKSPASPGGAPPRPRRAVALPAAASAG